MQIACNAHVIVGGVHAIRMRHRHILHVTCLDFACNLHLSRMRNIIFTSKLHVIF